MTFLYISSIAMPEDIGIASYVIAVSGIFAVVSRYGMPVYLVESVSNSSSSLAKAFGHSLSFCLNLSILVSLVVLVIFFLTDYIKVESSLFLLSVLLMIFLNPVSMLIEQEMILEKRNNLLSKNSFLKTILFPTVAFLTYKITENFAWSLVLANVSILSSPLLIYYFFNSIIVKIEFHLIRISEFLPTLKDAFPYFANSLGLILILSLDKIYVATKFSVDILGSYDLIWKGAILLEFFVLQPITALYSRHVIDWSYKSPKKLPILIAIFPIVILLVINLIDFSFIETFWNIFFSQYTFNQDIFKMAISFLIVMFSVNQLRNIMATRKLRIQSLISSFLILFPLIIIGTLSQFKSIVEVPQLLVIGSILGLTYNLLSLTRHESN